MSGSERGSMVRVPDLITRLNGVFFDVRDKRRGIVAVFM